MFIVSNDTNYIRCIRENGEFGRAIDGGRILYLKNIDSVKETKIIRPNYLDLNDSMTIKMIKDVTWNKWRGEICKCFCCDEFIDKSRMEIEFGHIIPASKGGSYTPENIRPICIKCNRGPGGVHT